MPPCAYCGDDQRLTREHVIPAWFSRQVDADSLETFNARRPLTHTRGDLVIKDVCSECNSRFLGPLDAYGRDLFLRFGSRQFFRNDTLTLDIDSEQLIRWLMKLCFNSGRAHNADVTVLSQYRDYMRFGGTRPPNVLIFAGIITMTRRGVIPPHPAERGEDALEECIAPEWFRITQMRLPSNPLTSAVQRQIHLNSLCFTLIVSDALASTGAAELPALKQEVQDSFPAFVEITESGCYTVTAGELDVYTSIYDTIAEYPLRNKATDPFVDPEFIDLLRAMVSAEVERVVFPVCRAEIEARDYGRLSAIIEYLCLHCETIRAGTQRVLISVDGYDDDPKDLWEIPEARSYLAELYTRHPELLYFADVERTVPVLLFCYASDGSDQPGRVTIDGNRASHFLAIGFDAMNHLMQRCAMSIEQSRSICASIQKMIEGLAAH